MRRASRTLSLLVLAVAAVATLYSVREFAQTRFFTVDEYQYGHATWLVSQGRKPYVDFYEHHFPLSYVLHAPVVAGDQSFAEKALRLRGVVFFYIVILSIALGGGALVSTRNAHVALLTSFMPLVLGFSLMSLVDYRSDLFGSVAFLSGVALLEVNRKLNRRSLSVMCGFLCAFAVLMTQKMLIQGGLAIGLFLVVDAVRAWNGSRGPVADPKPARLIAHPLVFVGTGMAVGLVAIAVAAAAGILATGFDITVVQALEHERFHAPTSLAKYLGRAWAMTGYSTAAIIACAIAYLGFGRDWFWSGVLLAAAIAVANVKAQHPYNYVYICLVIGICAVRGYGWLVEKASERFPRAAGARSLLYLIPLLAIPSQLGFAWQASSNEYQLKVMSKVEKYSQDGDVVIDNAGGIMFRDHASYYWLHGPPHRILFSEYFENELESDYRESRALFWIWDFRFDKLPESVRSYLVRHYLRSDGDLYALGIFTPPTRGVAYRTRAEVVREDDYYVHRYHKREGELPGTEGIRIDGQPVLTDSVHLSEGMHEFEIAPGSPGYIISPLPRSFFDDRVSPRENLRYTKVFEYGSKDAEH